MALNQLGDLVLVVCNNSTNLDTLIQILRTAGFRVHTAISGGQALASARLLLPDLVMLDVCMLGVDGFQICEALTSEDCLHDIPVLFLITQEELINDVKTFKAGGTDFLTKPFLAEKVLFRVRQQIQFQRLRKELSRIELSMEQVSLELLKTDKLKAEMTAMLNNARFALWR